MTELEKMQIKTLLWKEWKQVRVFVALAIFILVGFSGIAVLDTIDLKETLSAGALIASVLTTIGLGVLSYGLEINEKTVSYLATRPVGHPQVFWSKVGLSLAVGWGVVLGSLIAWGMLEPGSFYEHMEDSHPFILRSWLFVPSIYLTVLFFILAIRPIVPSLIVAISFGLMAFFGCAATPLWIVIPLCLLMLGACYFLARIRLHSDSV